MKCSTQLVSREKVRKIPLNPAMMQKKEVHEQ